MACLQPTTQLSYGVCVYRLVKGDGEIIEEIVSKDRHKAINKVQYCNVRNGHIGTSFTCVCMQQATLGDGISFQSGLKKFL